MKSACFVVALVAIACVGDRTTVISTRVRMEFERPDGFFSAPFPSDDLRRPDGRIAIGGFPNPTGVGLVGQAKDLLSRDARGFATTGAIAFQMTGALERTSLPSLSESLLPDAPVFLIDIDPASPDTLRRSPIAVSFFEDGGPFGAPNLLSLLPVQGVPLRPGTRYAAVVTRRVRDARGQPIGASPTLESIANDSEVPGLSTPARATYRGALDRLNAAGVAVADIAGLAVFTTDAPTALLGQLKREALLYATPTFARPIAARERFDDYCVYEGVVRMPVYQRGEPPFLEAGGDFAFDASGKPRLARFEEANIVVTIPRATMPTAGFPVAVFIRTGGGGERPLVDRGPHRTAGGEAIASGTGPALVFARAGFAGVSVDGPHGGRRNVTRGDEQFLIFNLFNAAALRDNIRQSALEIALLPHLIRQLEIDATACPTRGGSPGNARVVFDLARLALMGHSMGATILPLAMAHEPLYGAAILSGAGASWIENILHKQKPLDVRPLAESMIGYSSLGRALTAHDPVLSLVQWAAESADPQVYARTILREPAAGERARHVLMLQGIIDHYIPPPVANALSLAMGLDLAGVPLDRTPVTATSPESSSTSILSFLPLSGRRSIPLPATSNITAPDGRSAATGVVVQHREDGIEDGHEVVFQTEPPQHQIRCFLETFARGVPVVSKPDVVMAPCD